MAESKIKKTPEEIRKAILETLKGGPKTVTEISKVVNSNWITIGQYLKELREEKKVIEIISSPKMKVYRRADDLAFYGLPFSKKIREDTLGLLWLIAKTWKKQTNSSPPRTILQKIAVELIERSKGEIDLPVLKFHYGQTTALRFDEESKNEYKIFNLSKEQHKILLKLIDEYKDWSSARVKKKQYEKPEMRFYKIKEELLDAFSKSNEEVVRKILELSVYYPSELEETYELFDKFEYCSINILNIKKKNIKKEYTQKLKEIFSLIWDSITTNYFFYEAERYIQEDKKGLFDYIKLNTLNSKISNITPIIDDLKSEVDSIPPEEINMEMSKKSNELLNRLLNGT